VQYVAQVDSVSAALSLALTLPLRRAAASRDEVGHRRTMAVSRLRDKSEDGVRVRVLFATSIHPACK
jgi:hypothetical protein